MKSGDEVTSNLELVRLKARLATELAAVPHLQPISARLQRDVGLPNLLMEALQSAVAISEADFGNVQFLDADTGSLKIVAQHGFQQNFLDYFNQVHPGQFGCGSAMQRQSRVIVEDVSSDPIFRGTGACGVMLKAEARACQSTPLLNREGKVIGMISTHFRTLKELSESKLQLLDLLAQQTAELVEAAEIERVLRRNEHVAAASQLAGTLAHEINNPLQALTNLVALLSKEPGSEEAQAWVKMARHELDRLIEITQRLLVTDGYQHPSSNSLPKDKNGNAD